MNENEDLLLKFVKPSIEDDEFDAYRQEFEQVIKELSQNSVYDDFRGQFENLWSSIASSKEKETNLIQKMAILKADHLVLSMKSEILRKYQSNDPSVMIDLKSELDSVKKKIEDARQKEDKIREEIKTVNYEIDQLYLLLEEDPSFTQSITNIKLLVDKKSDLLHEKVHLEKENEKLVRSIAQVKERIVECQSEHVSIQSAIGQLSKEIQVKKNEEAKETRKKEKIQTELENLKNDYSIKERELARLMTMIEKNLEEIQKKEKDVQNLKGEIDKVNNEISQLAVKSKDNQTINDHYSDEIANLERTVNASKAEIKRKEEELTTTKGETKKLEKQIEQTARQIETIEEKRKLLDMQRETIKEQMNAYNVEIEMIKKNREREKKLGESLTKERDNLRRNLTKVSDETKRQKNLVKLHEQSKRNLDMEIATYRDEARERRKLIYQLEKERDSFIERASILSQKVFLQIDEIKEKEGKVIDMKKKISDAETKHKQQVSLLDSVKLEKNQYSKNLSQCNKELAENTTKLKTMRTKIQQLKEDTHSKEVAIGKLNAERQILERQNEKLEEEVVKLRSELAKTKNFVSVQENEEKKLIKVIADSEHERNSLKKKLNQIISDNNKIQEKIYEKSNELRSIIGNIQMEQIKLVDEEKEYANKLAEIDEIKRNIRLLREEKARLQEKGEKKTQLRKEIIGYEKKLVNEQVRAACLEEELKTPMNVHEWRILEMFQFDNWENYQDLPFTCDPGAYEMISSVQQLKKKIKDLSIEIEKKREKIKILEREYYQSIRKKSREPGIEVIEQMERNKQIMQERQEKIRKIDQELEAYEKLVKDMSFQIEKAQIEKKKEKLKSLSIIPHTNCINEAGESVV